MTSSELRSIAERGGLIQWLRSGIVEQIYIGRSTRRIYARNLVTLRFHPLHDANIFDWFCREVRQTDHIRLGDLLPKSKSSTRQPGDRHGTL